jgi:hypothetical protein
LTGLVTQAALILALGQGGTDGYATHYSPGLFERVARNRGMPVAACLVADDVAQLGAWLWVRGVRTGALRHCQVTDLSHGSATVPGSDKWRHLRDGLIELDHDSAVEVCGEWFSGPWRHCPVTIWRG